MVHLGHCHINKVRITQSPPNRSGCPLIDKISNTVHLVNASYMTGTDTAKVEGLWLSNRPQSVCLNTQMTIQQQLKSSSSVTLSLLYFPTFYA